MHTTLQMTQNGLIPRLAVPLIDDPGHHSRRRKDTYVHTRMQLNTRQHLHECWL